MSFWRALVILVPTCAKGIIVDVAICALVKSLAVNPLKSVFGKVTVFPLQVPLKTASFSPETSSAQLVFLNWKNALSEPYISKKVLSEPETVAVNSPLPLVYQLVGVFHVSFGQVVSLVICPWFHVTMCQ